jgi:membrane-associated protease RseP (regulator of RpoE activity)
MWEVAGIALFLLLLMASIALHEIGHLVPAKRFGVRVPEYMVGFGPTLFSWKWGETKYGIKAFPLGGYIRMVGMLPPPKDAPEGTARRFSTGRAGMLIADARKQALEEVKPEDAHRVFYKLPPWKRIIIMMGGPMMNLFLAAVMFTSIITLVGFAQPTTEVSRVAACLPTASDPSGVAAATGECAEGVSPAAAAGISSGEVIVGFDGKAAESWPELLAWVRESAGTTVPIEIRRGSETRLVEVAIPGIIRPVYDDSGEETGATVEVGYLGIYPEFDFQPQPLTTVPGFMWDMTVRSASSLMTLPNRLYDLVSETLIQGEERSVNSPISVVGASRIGGEVIASNETAEGKIIMFFGLAASVNLFLFLFNLLPILPLDGGHVAGALYQSIRTRISKIRGKPDPGPVDIAKMLPLAYATAALLLVVGGVVILADVVKPLSII